MDIGSDHNPVVGKLDVQLKKLKYSNKKSIDMRKLKNKDTKTRTKELMIEKFSTKNLNTEDVWDKFKHE